MLKKTKKTLEHKVRPTWVGYYSRTTPTKAERIRKSEKKYKGREVYNDSSAFLF